MDSHFSTTSRTTWKCTRSFKKCRAGILTFENCALISNYDHNHLPLIINYSELPSKIFRVSYKRRKH